MGGSYQRTLIVAILVVGALPLVVVTIAILFIARESHLAGQDGLMVAVAIGLGIMILVTLTAGAAGMLS